MTAFIKLSYKKYYWVIGSTWTTLYICENKCLSWFFVKNDDWHKCIFYHIYEFENIVYDIKLKKILF